MTQLYACPSCGRYSESQHDSLTVRLCRFAEHDDDEAFAQLLEITEHRLRAYAARVCQQHYLRDVAENAVQQTALKMIAARRQFDCSRPAWPWMKRIVWSQCFEESRRLQRYRKHVKRLWIGRVDENQSRSRTTRHPEPEAPSMYEPPAAAESNEFVGDIRAFLTSRCSALDRMMVDMRIDKKSYEEIAKELNIPLSIIGGRLHRLREQVREFLEQRSR